MTFLQNNDIITWSKQCKNPGKRCLYSFELIATSEQLHSAHRVSSLVTTEDNNIVSGGGDGSITISLFDFHTKKFTIYIYKYLLFSYEKRYLWSESCSTALLLKAASVESNRR